MGLFNHKKSSYVLDLDAINKSLNNDLLKSMNAKSVSVSALDGLVFSGGGDSEKDLKLNTEQILKKKKILNRLANNILIQSIIRTRTNQVLRYCSRARLTSDGIGFKIVKDVDNGKVTSHEANIIKNLEDFVYYTGFKSSYNEMRDTFPEFVAKLINDFYVQDQINVERVYSKDKTLNHFNMVDASTVVIDKVSKTLDGKRTFSQWVDNNKVATFNEDELTFITYWKKTDVSKKGYGQSPLEDSVDYVDYFNYTTSYNGSFFKQGGTTKGLLFLNTDNTQLAQEQLEAIRRAWKPLQGLQGAWRIPLVSGVKDAKFVSLQQNSGDYEFSGWLSFLINIISSEFQIDPSELNFPNKSGGSMSRGGGSTLNEGNTQKTKATMSKTKGLVPILDFIERIMNDYILSKVPRANGYHFVFTLGNEDEKQKVDIISQKLKNGMTINEARKEQGLPPLQGKFGKIANEIPGDSNNFLQFISVQDKLNGGMENKLQQNAKQIDRPNKQDGAPLETNNNDKPSTNE